MKLIFMGTSSFAVPSLKKILKNKSELKAVFTRPDAPKGRGLQKSSSAVKSFLEKNKKELQQQNKNNFSLNKLEIFQPENLRSAENIKALKKINPDLIIVAAYGLIIPSEILAIPRFGCLNIHPSLLPKYRGPSPIQTAILNQEIYTGVTIIKLNSQLDTGDIIAQQKLKIPMGINAPQLENKLAVMGSNLLIKILPDYLTGKLKPRKQTSPGQPKPSYTKLFEKKDGLINWKRPAKEIAAQIRALALWPGTYTFLKIPGEKNKLRIDIVSAQFSSDPAKHPPGLIFLTKNNRLAVATSQDILILDSIRPSGKKEMNALDFANGHSYFIGSTFQKE